MMAIGHALVCDQKYEGSSFNAHRLWCLWNFLHEYLVNRAWSFETAGQSDPQLYAALAKAAVWCVSDFNVQILANTAGAFAAAR